MCAINDGALVPHLKPSGPLDTGKSASNGFVVDLDLCRMNRRDCYGGILFLMRSRKRNWRFLIGLEHEFERRPALHSTSTKYFFGFSSLRRRHHRDSWLNNSGF